MDAQPLPRHRWRDTYRKARQSCPAKGWVRDCFPRGWVAADALRTSGLRRPLEPVPHRVAIMLACAADERRKGRREGARLYLGMARRANHHRDLVALPAYGA